jgi:hypothetical protein
VNAGVSAPATGTTSATARVFGSQVSLALSDLLEGVTIEDVLTAEGGATTCYAAMPTRSNQDLKGKLIVDVFIERTFPRRDGKPGNKRRFPVGTLPALSFEIVPSL